MAVVINNFEIINSGTQLAIDVQTTVGYDITSLMLWNINTFKDYSLAVNLNYKLENSNNREVIIVTTSELGISKFEDIYFIEVQDNAPNEDCPECLYPALGITYSLTNYYQCMLNFLLKSEIDNCLNCKDTNSKNTLITISLLIDSIEKSIDLGYYLQAISTINKLKKLCSLEECNECGNVSCTSCSKFKQIV